MERGDVAAESAITLPISEERYEELKAGITPNNRAWNDIADALKTIASLQGYRLGSWSIEIKIEG
jgi:hypothetical protein